MGKVQKIREVTTYQPKYKTLDRNFLTYMPLTTKKRVGLLSHKSPKLRGTRPVRQSDFVA